MIQEKRSPPQKEFNIKAPSKEGDFLKKRLYFVLIFCHKILSMEGVLLFQNQPDKLPVNLVPLLNLPGAVNRLHQLREPLFFQPLGIQLYRSQFYAIKVRHKTISCQNRRVASDGT